MIDGNKIVVVAEPSSESLQWG